ncbi:hypothetical protein PTKIN_Ptkin05aG0113700 [Pterospermum kingtungense]
MRPQSSFSLSQSTPIESDAQGHSSSSNSQLPTIFRGKERSRSYIAWNREMNALFASVLDDQIALGNKSEEWKPQAYQAVADALNAKLGLNLVIRNVKNRMKAWKKHYAVITNILTRTKFKWEDDKKMVVITIDDITFPEAHGYQNKVIENRGDIVILCGSDRATRDGAENFQDVSEAMDQEGNEVQSNIDLKDQETSRTQSFGKTKRARKDPLADVVMEIPSHLKKIWKVKRVLKGHNLQEKKFMTQSHRFLDFIEWKFFQLFGS